MWRGLCGFRLTSGASLEMLATSLPDVPSVARGKGDVKLILWKILDLLQREDGLVGVCLLRGGGGACVA